MLDWDAVHLSWAIHFLKMNKLLILTLLLCQLKLLGGVRYG